MILEKIERLVDLSLSETCEAKAAQQSCYYNLNHLKKKIENNQTLNETTSKVDILLPKLDNKKEKEMETIQNTQNFSFNVSQIFRVKDKQKDKQKGNEKKKPRRTTVQQWKKLVFHRNFYQSPNGCHSFRSNQALKNFQIKVSKNRNKIPIIGKLTKEQRFYQAQQIKISKNIVDRIGLYEAGNLFKKSNIQKFIENNNHIKPITNTRFFNFNSCTKNQLFLTNPKDLNPNDFIQDCSKNKNKENDKTDHGYSTTQFDPILEDPLETEIVQKKYWILSVSNYEIIKNEDYFAFKIDNIQQWIDINFILIHIVKYLRSVKISNLTFKFNKEEFFNTVWFGKKINLKIFQKLLKIRFQIQKKSQFSKRCRMISTSKVFNNKAEIISQIVRIWKDRKFLNTKKKQKTKENQIFKWIALRFLAKIKIRRNKEIKKKRAFRLYDNFIKNGGNYEIQIYLPSFSESQFLRNTTQYMQSFENLYYHIWKHNDKQIILVLPAINENLLNLYKKRIKTQSNITIICPQSHYLFPKTLPLSACLLFSSQALLKIQNLITDKPAIIIPGRYQSSNLYYELTLSEYLNTPLHCSIEKNFSLGAIKKLLTTNEIQTSVHRVIEAKAKMETLISQLAQLLIENPKVNIWVLKMNQEFNGRGIATFLAKSSKKLKQILSQVEYHDSMSKLGLKQQEERKKRVIAYLQIHLKLKLKVNFQNCIFRVEEYLLNFLKLGGIIEQFHEGYQTYELFFNYSPEKIYKAFIKEEDEKKSLVSFAKNYSLDFVTRASTFGPAEQLPSHLQQLVSKIDFCLTKNDFHGHVTVTVISDKATEENYVIDIKPFMTMNFSLFYFFESSLIKNFQEELQDAQTEMRNKKMSSVLSDMRRQSLNDSQNQLTNNSSVKLIREKEKLNSFVEQENQDEYFCLFIPVIIFTDVDELVRAELIEEIITENWQKLDNKYIKEKEKQQNFRSLYISLGLTLSLILYGKAKELKKMKKSAIQQMRKLSEKVDTIRLYRGKNQTRDVFQFGDVIRAIAKIKL